MEVQIIIKAPNQNVEDHVVPCNLDWTVENLKDHLSKAYPNKPMVDEQKLIYSGRLLHNHLHLKDVLRHDESQSSVHILHLVCNSDSSFEPRQVGASNLTRHPWRRRRRLSIRPPSQTWGNSATRRSPVVNNATSGQSASNTVRQRNVASVPPTNTFYPQFPQNLAPQATMPVFIPDSQVVAQIAAMQQMYAYYFSQYIQSMNPTTVPANNPVFPGIPNYQHHTNEVPAQNHPNQRHHNAQGAQLLDENDELLNRDWLDHLFLCCRFLILFSLVYFYSTPERLMIVIVFAVVAFLYQEGWFVRRVIAPVPEEVPVPEENPNIADPPDLENSDEEPLLVNQDLSANDDLFGEYELEATMDGDDPPHAQQTDDANNNHIFSPLTFLSTFFSSLIPEPPPPININ